MSTETTVSKQPRKPPQAFNTFAKFLLTTPFHSLVSRSLMLLTFKGRKSGQQFTIPIGYQQIGTIVSCFTDHNWWKNLETNPEVTLLIKRQTLQGRAEVIHGDIETIAHELEIYIQHSPRAAQAFNIATDTEKKPLPASLRQVAQIVTLIRIQLNN